MQLSELQFSHLQNEGFEPDDSSGAVLLCSTRISTPPIQIPPHSGDPAGHLWTRANLCHSPSSHACSQLCVERGYLAFRWANVSSRPRGAALLGLVSALNLMVWF